MRSSTGHVKVLATRHMGRSSTHGYKMAIVKRESAAALSERTGLVEVLPCLWSLAKIIKPRPSSISKLLVNTSPPPTYLVTWSPRKATPNPRATLTRDLPSPLTAVMVRVFVIDHFCPFPTRAQGIQ